MVKSFVKLIIHYDYRKQELPSCYDILYKKENFPIGSVILRSKNDMIWDAEIIEEGETYTICNGWKKIVDDLNIEEHDFLIFELTSKSTFNLIHLTEKDVSDRFHYWLITAATEKMKLPVDYVKHHLKEEDDKQMVYKMQFGSENEWKVVLEKKSKGFYFTYGWNNVFKDLCLHIGDVLTFEHNGKDAFNIRLFVYTGLEVEPIIKEKNEVIDDTICGSDVSQMNLKGSDVFTQQSLKSENGTKVCNDFNQLTQKWLNKVKSIMSTNTISSDTSRSELKRLVSSAVAFPNNFTGVVDTHDVITSGIPNFCAVALALNDLGYRAKGIKIKSGDLGLLWCEARKLFCKIEKEFHVPYFGVMKITTSNEMEKRVDKREAEYKNGNPLKKQKRVDEKAIGAHKMDLAKFPSHNEAQENVEKPKAEVVKIITERFRFSSDFGRDAEFSNVTELKVRFENGEPVTQRLRSEKSRNEVRFAICEWKKCMNMLGLVNGGTYRVKYMEKEGMLIFSNP